MTKRDIIRRACKLYDFFLFEEDVKIRDLAKIIGDFHDEVLELAAAVCADNGCSNPSCRKCLGNALAESIREMKVSIGHDRV